MSTARRRALLLGCVVTAVVAVAALLASGLRHDPSDASSPLVGRAAPNFRLGGLDGPPMGLSDLRGKVGVINFWASWCAECHTEQPALNTTWERFRDSGVVVLGVDFEDNDADARHYVAAEGSDYPVVVDPDSRTALAFGVRGVPETFVVDQQGRIVQRVVGAVDADKLAATINGLLGERAR